MGGKKSSKKPPVCLCHNPLPKKVAPKLDKVFNCPFCNHEKSVGAKLDYDKQVGTISCNTCSRSWQTRITRLSDPIDVYSEWIDACEEANKGGKKAKTGGDDDDDSD